VNGAATGRRRIARLLALGTALAAVSGVAACGGGDREAGETSSANQPEVGLVDFALEPAETTIEAGQTVTFDNRGEQIHNVRGPGFFSEALTAGESYSHRFMKPGRFPYLCTLHPTLMRGAITVKPR
jgi:plastocyanin